MAKKEEGIIMASLDQYDDIMINSNPKVLCPFQPTTAYDKNPLKTFYLDYILNWNG